MRGFDAPFTVYVASDFASGTGRLWWVALEMVIAKASSIEAPIGGVATRFDTSTVAAKQAAFDRLHDWLRSLPGEHDLQREISALCARHGVALRLRGVRPAALPLVRWLFSRRREVPIVPSRSTAILFQGRGVKA